MDNKYFWYSWNQRQLNFILAIATLGISLLMQTSASALQVAQVPSADQLAQPNLPQDLPPPQDVLPPSTPPLQPPTVPSPPPDRDDLLPTNPTPNLPQQPTPEVPIKLLINNFQFEGSSVFKDERLLQAIEAFVFEKTSNLLNEKSRCERLKRLDREPPPRKLPRNASDPPVELRFAQLLEARFAITQLYICKGYITSGALIPAEQELPPPPQAGAVKIQIVEGTLEGIQVIGNRRLNQSYIRNRLARANKKPINREQLLEALQLLQLNPRIENLSAELAAGKRFGTNLLIVRVEEARTFHGQIALDNNRSPGVGTFQRSARLTEENLLGIGDSVSLSYANTDGSNEVNLSYALPLTPEETTLTFSYGKSWNNVIEKPVDRLDISSNSENYQLALSHPLFRNPRQELTLEVALSHQQTQTSIGLDNIGPFPISPGADDEGRTRISALRFSQQWTDRRDRSVFALRSQFSLGLDLLGATINNSEPDSRFFAWRGQAQWVRLLSKNTLLVLRGDLQLADRRLVSLEQFRLGGQASVRGFRQDALLADNGFFSSAELRLPIKTFPEIQGLLQIVPFIDVGTGWNNFEGSDLKPNPLLSAGLGLRFQMSDRLDARFDWGIPLVSTDSNNRTLQEQGLYFSVLWNPF
ncbi:ShlB/FhaC/HecB family hemolysin secretion/activation protein [Dendronalium sp. ChiSLP03b]|uniref:ShlB/FhaC/HecB family hemolysin secretion/activation protein n=1 Tax=Dendronalium sp. ChiSLP03b TaxID=3075381 RepID=UPI002AD3CD70|nr:ShlB/FhaC/HecB family hemolysin secretion/activation protein [Dendronalium sp. ChiSLP03b]MDZ8208312.1 ShlB/FhaC/HecB family hemolysin secretion/activation protein [Dendronalium sp. ChiSLP03b]